VIEFFVLFSWLPRERLPRVTPRFFCANFLRLTILNARGGLQFVAATADLKL